MTDIRLTGLYPQQAPLSPPPAYVQNPIPPLPPASSTLKHLFHVAFPLITGVTGALIAYGLGKGYEYYYGLTGENITYIPDAILSEKIVFIDKPFYVNNTVYVDKPFVVEKTIEVTRDVPIEKIVYVDKFVEAQCPELVTTKIIHEYIDPYNGL